MVIEDTQFELRLAQTAEDLRLAQSLRYDVFVRELGSDGDMVDDYVIECALHGAQFDLRNGEVLEPPASDGLSMFEVKVEGNDVLVRTEG